jgi:hypothetical protein
MTHGLPAGVKVHPVLTDMHITPARPIRRNVDEPHLFGARVHRRGTIRPIEPSRSSARSSQGYAVSRASEVDRSRKAFACSCRSFAFCSAMPMASAPAMKRRGGCFWLAIVMRARASLAGSPAC